MQSFWPEGRRRYSSDVEIITTTTRAEVAAWMKREKWEPAEVVPGKILKSQLTPDGTLFVIHDYGRNEFSATEPRRQPFGHFPLPTHPPPEALEIPLLDYDFLIATKVYGIQDNKRGGERNKDIHDLGIGCDRSDPARVLHKLELYIGIRGDQAPPNEVVRAAGAWVRHFQDDRMAEFGKWRARFVRDPKSFNDGVDLATALRYLETMYGGPIAPTPAEGRRFLLYQVTPKKLAPIALGLGYTGPTNKELEKMSDFVARTAFPKLQRPAPSGAEGLLDELEALIADSSG